MSGKPWVVVVILILVYASLGIASDYEECGTADSLEWFKFGGAPCPPDTGVRLPPPMSAPRLFLVFAKLQDDDPDVSCQDNPRDGWPRDNTNDLPPFAGRVVYPYSRTFDEEEASSYPYRGNVTHFYYDMSLEKHLVTDSVFSRTIVLPGTAMYWDTLGGEASDSNACYSICYAVIESLDAAVDFSGDFFHNNDDEYVDVPIVVIVRYRHPRMWLAHFGGLFTGDRDCFITDDWRSGLRVHLHPNLGIFQGGSNYSQTVSTLIHEYGHYALGDPYWGCDDTESMAGHFATIDGFGRMDGNAHGRSSLLSAVIRDRAGWQAAVRIDSNAAGIEVRPFVDYSDPGDIVILPIDTLMLSSPLCQSTPSEEYFLVENRQKLSFWEDPYGNWKEADSLFPCSYDAPYGSPTGTPGTGLVIFHVDERAGGRNAEIRTSPGRIVNCLDVESAGGRYDAKPDGGEYRVLQDQRPLPTGDGGWNRLNLWASWGDSSGIWSGADLWNERTSNTFAPYTNPGTGAYRVYGHPAPGAYGFQDVPSGIGVLNIRSDESDTTVMLFDLYTNLPTPPDSLYHDSIHVNTTWQGRIRLNADIVVDSGITLAIGPGSVVVASANHDEWEDGREANRVEIRVDGELRVLGTEEDPVIFTSAFDGFNLNTPAYAADSTAMAGQWTGIVVAEGGMVRLQGAKVRYAIQGLRILNGLDDSCSVINCIVSNCLDEGIWVKNTDGVVISGCKVDSCGSYGMKVINGSARITGNTVENNSEGIYAKNAAVVVDTNIVRMNGTGQSDVGVQVHLLGPSDNAIEVTGNFIGGSKSFDCDGEAQDETCYVKKGLLYSEGFGLGDVVRITSNTFKYIDQGGIEMSLRDVIEGGGVESFGSFTLGEGDTADIRGNEFHAVALPYDLSWARYTNIALTAAVDFDYGVRTNGAFPSLGRVGGGDPRGGFNFFSGLPDSAAYILATEILTDTLFAENNCWNWTVCDSLDSTLFKSPQGNWPELMHIDPCLMVSLYQFPWNYWEGSSLKASARVESEERTGAKTNTGLGLTASPNPVRGSEVLFQMNLANSPEMTMASLRIYDIAGRLVRDFAVPVGSRTGIATVGWDGRSNEGADVGSGVYFARLRLGDEELTRRVVLVR